MKIFIMDAKTLSNLFIIYNQPEMMFSKVTLVLFFLEQTAKYAARPGHSSSERQLKRHFKKLRKSLKKAVS